MTLYGTPSGERRERSRWKWWNMAAAAIVAVVAVACAVGGYSFWWLFFRK